MWFNLESFAALTIVLSAFTTELSFTAVVEVTTSTTIVVVEVSARSALDVSTVRTSDVGGELLAVLFDKVVFDWFVIGKRAETNGMDDRLVDEDVFTASRWGDETKALGGVEELDSAG